MAFNTSQQPGIIPFDWLQRSFQYWWLLVLTMVLGGLIGLSIHALQPPVYEAKAQLVIHLDLTQTGEIAQNDEELAFMAALNLISSTQVRDEVIESAKKNNIPITQEQFLNNSVVERFNEFYELRFRDPDPQTAAEITNLWANAAFRQLKDAAQHAHQAYLIRSHMDALEQCLERSAGPATGQATCSLLSIQQLQENLSVALTSWNAEILASRTINPLLLFDLARSAETPTRPVVYARNTFVLCGALIGFILGVIAIQYNLQSVITRRIHLA